MAPDDRITVREDSSYHYGVWDGPRWLATFQFFADASEFAAKITIDKESRKSIADMVAEARLLNLP